MALMCEAGHHRRGKGLGDACGLELRTNTRTPQYCKGRMIEAPTIHRCNECGRGFYSNGNCSYCGALEPGVHVGDGYYTSCPDDEWFGCSLCGKGVGRTVVFRRWFPTLADWKGHQVECSIRQFGEPGSYAEEVAAAQETQAVDEVAERRERLLKGRKRDRVPGSRRSGKRQAA